VQAATGWGPGRANKFLAHFWDALPMVGNAKLSPRPKNKSNILETMLGINRKQHY
jgi:hypothetical protein